MTEKFTKWDEAKLFVDNYIKIWAIFVNWFTWSFGINIAAMAYISTTAKPSIDNYLIIPLCAFMSMFVIIGITATIFMYNYCKNCQARIEILKTEIADESGHLIDADLAVASPALNAASLLILLSFIWLLAAWGFVAAWASGLIAHGRV